MDPSRPTERRRGAQLRVSFLEELNTLEAAALGGLAAAVEDLDRVIAALSAHDATAAGLVVTDGEPLGQRCTQINNSIVGLLARQAPVASDLRLAAGLLHLVKHLERIGDQCVNIAKMVPLMGTHPPEEEAVAARVAEMGRIVRSEVVQARQAFELRDSTLARSIRDTDQRVNVLNKEVFRLSIDLGDDADVREWLFTMAMIARALERIGDNAVDIGQLVLFVTGDSQIAP